MGGEKLKLFRSNFRFLLLVSLLIAGFFSVAVPLFAQTAFDESTIFLDDIPDVQDTNVGSSILIMLRMVLVLALSALAIYGVVFFIKRLFRPRENPDPHLKVLARVPLAGDAFAAVISLGAKAWLVGGGSGGVNLISEVEEVESLETLLLEDARKNAETKRFLDFRSLLRFGRGGKKLSSQDGTFSGNGSLKENLQKQRERLKGL